MVKFWLDKWVDGNDPLILMATHNVPIDCMDQIVSTYVSDSGEWDWYQLINYLPPQIILKIAAIKPPFPGGDSDFTLWPHTPSKKFSVKSAYQLQMKDQWVAKKSYWNVV